MQSSIEYAYPEDLKIVLQRYGTGSEIYNQPVLDYCLEMGINPELIHLICLAFDKPTAFPAEQLYDFPMEDILNYLEKTHSYYLEKLIPETEQLLVQLIRVTNSSSSIPMEVFFQFTEYRKELESHIRQEEELLFPYIRKLLQTGEGEDTYSITRFSAEHEHGEHHLSEIRQFLVENNQETTLYMPYELLLNKLELIERDITVHAKIEEEVLVPKARILEKM